ncbi:MAG: hypothetical protein JWQ66_2803, partial [Mucilaginibacter sp.]|nr:hypothetical protein [Mucilaginibacter sp.]
MVQKEPRVKIFKIARYCFSWFLTLELYHHSLGGKLQVILSCEY